MKKLILCSAIVLGLTLNVGCAQEKKVQDIQNNKVSTNQSVQEQSDVDIKDVMNKVSAIDKDLKESEKKEITLEPEKQGWEPQTLSIWIKEGKPVKVTATQADDAGKMDGLASFYLEDEKLILFKAPFSNHIFKDDKMVLWLDESMKPLDNIPVKDMKDAEKGIQEELTRILDIFNKKDGNATDDNIVRFESGDINFSDVSYVESESNRDEKLEKAIKNVLKYNKNDGPLAYYYNKIDLNGDKKPETFVYLSGSSVSGTGGSTALIFEDDKDAYKLVSRFTLVQNPIVVSNSKTNGWNDLIMYVSGGGIEPFYSQIKFDGNKYPSNPSVQPEVKSGTIIKGTAIIADDISKNSGIEVQ